MTTRERDFLTYTVHRKGAKGGQLFALLLDSFALERNFRKLLGIEKVGGSQVIIAGCDSRIDARGLDNDRYR